MTVPLDATRDDVPPLPPAVAVLVDEFRDGLDGALGDAFASLYLYGSLTFPRPERWRVDIDFHVLVDYPLGDAARRRLHELHRHLARTTDLGRELDGYYITLADARLVVPPRNQANLEQRDEAWALHRAHVQSGRCVLVTGLDPRSVVPEPTWAELETALRTEMCFIEAHPEHDAFGILNACRILYSVRTRDVVISKYDAARRSRTTLPGEWHAAVDAAVRDYAQTSSPDDRTAIRDGWGPIVAYVRRVMDARAP